MGSPKNDGAVRTKIRKKLRAWGMDENELELCLAQIKQRQREKRERKLPWDAPLCIRAEYLRLLRKNKPAKDNSAAILKLGENYQTPDDKGYRPTHVDPILKGSARATGATAKAVKRGTSFSQYDYEKEK